MKFHTIETALHSLRRDDVYSKTAADYSDIENAIVEISNARNTTGQYVNVGLIETGTITQMLIDLTYDVYGKWQRIFSDKLRELKPDITVKNALTFEVFKSKVLDRYPGYVLPDNLLGLAYQAVIFNWQDNEADGLNEADGTRSN